MTLLICAVNLAVMYCTVAIYLQCWFISARLYHWVVFDILYLWSYSCTDFSATLITVLGLKFMSKIYNLKWILNSDLISYWTVCNLLTSCKVILYNMWSWDFCYRVTWLLIYRAVFDIYNIFFVWNVQHIYNSDWQIAYNSSSIKLLLLKFHAKFAY